MRLFVSLGLLKRGNLGLGQEQAVLRHFGFAGFQAQLHRRSCRCHTHRTPAGEIDRPRPLSASATRIWPQAGCSIAIYYRSFDLDWRAVLQDRLTPADLLQCQLAAYVHL